MLIIRQRLSVLPGAAGRSTIPRSDLREPGYTMNLRHD